MFLAEAPACTKALGAFEGLREGSVTGAEKGRTSQGFHLFSADQVPGNMLSTLHGSLLQPHEVGTFMVRHGELVSFLPRSHSSPKKQVRVRPGPRDPTPGSVLLIFLPPGREQ